jgi:hypothetical protein
VLVLLIKVIQLGAHRRQTTPGPAYAWHQQITRICTITGWSELGHAAVQIRRLLARRMGGQRQNPFDLRLLMSGGGLFPG